MPRSIRPRPISRAASAASANVTSRQPPSTLCRAAIRSPYCSAARPIRSAIVFEPVVRTGTVVPACIASSSVNDCSGGRFYAAARRGRSGCEGRLRGGPGGLLLRAVAEVREEERLVDAALEDRDAHLHALRDDFLALEACLASQFRGRQVNSHWQISLPWDVCTVLHIYRGVRTSAREMAATRSLPCRS